MATVTDQENALSDDVIDQAARALYHYVAPDDHSTAGMERLAHEQSRRAAQVLAERGLLADGTAQARLVEAQERIERLRGAQDDDVAELARLRAALAAATAAVTRLRRDLIAYCEREAGDSRATLEQVLKMVAWEWQP